jgi:subtilisin family serine protease
MSEYQDDQDSREESSTRSSSSRHREPSLSPPEYVLSHHGGRILDPANAVRLPGQRPIRPTVYIGARLLLRGAAVTDEKVPAALGAAAKQAGLTAEVDREDQELVELARRAELVRLAQRAFVVRVHLSPADTGPAGPPDAWQVLQNYRALVGFDSQLAKQVSLDHLVIANADIEGEKGPLWDGHGIGSPWGGTPPTGSPISEFGIPGRGGRSPVAWVGARPARNEEFGSRRPVVAILDTGVGRHPWLTYPVVQRHPHVGTLPIGLGSPSREAEGRTVDPLQGTLDPDGGHGTFIAGLIHQTCPDANILSVRVMHGDGAVAEADILQALNRLLLRQAIALKDDQPKPEHVIDVISLSLGYYHEFPSDASFDQLILRTLRELGRHGVVVVASAGNDATSRHMYPAGFAPHDGTHLPTRRDAVPLASVGAHNPDGRTVALFSNQGAWVTCYRRGAAVVSTMPTTFRGGMQPSVRIRIGHFTRQTLDMDDYRNGFGVWSGTSFSAPVLAGELVAKMIEDGNLDKPARQDAVDRGWAAVEAVTGVSRP